MSVVGGGMELSGSAGLGGSCWRHRVRVLVVTGSVLTSTASCTAFRAVSGGTPRSTRMQAPVGGRVLAQRSVWRADLVAQMASAVVAGHWSDADLAVVAGGVGPD